MRILIIEDDQRIAANVKAVLLNEHFTIDVTYSGSDGLFRVETEDYDVIILDWMLPDMDGIKLCSKLREKRIVTPILMLTAKSQLEDKVEGLSAGADDYLTKPFEMEELLARIKALIRRKAGVSQSPSITIGDLLINTNTCEVKRQSRIIALAPKEYALLEYLARNSCRVIDRMELLSHVWGEDVDEFSNTVDVHIRYLRKKIDEDFDKKYIKTVVNKGYMLCAD